MKAGYLNEDVVLGIGSGIKVDDLWTQAGRRAVIHLPTGVCQALANSQVLRRKTIASRKSQCASEIAYQMILSK